MRLRRGGKNAQKNYTKMVIMTGIRMMLWSHIKADILEYEVKWSLGSITTRKAREGDEIPAEMFKISKE